jgi:hypothetical protein
MIRDSKPQYDAKEFVMSLQLSIQIGAVVALAVVVVIVAARRRLGELNAASWLVIWGALILLTEHPQFAIAYAVGFADELLTHPMTLTPHARIHFFMAGIYTIIGLVLLCVIARTLLREGRRAGWYSVLFALILGAGSDLVIGAQWFQHGPPLYRLFDIQSIGFGWEILYVYFVTWIAALVVSYKAVFAKSPA